MRRTPRLISRAPRRYRKLQARYRARRRAGRQRPPTLHRSSRRRPRHLGHLRPSSKLPLPHPLLRLRKRCLPMKSPLMQRSYSRWRLWCSARLAVSRRNLLLTPWRPLLIWRGLSKPIGRRPSQHENCHTTCPSRGVRSGVHKATWRRRKHVIRKLVLKRVHCPLIVTKHTSTHTNRSS